MTCQVSRWQWQVTMTDDNDRWQWKVSVTGGCDRWLWQVTVICVNDSWQWLFNETKEEIEMIFKIINVRYSLLIYFYNTEQLSSSLVSIQDFEEEIWGSNPHIIWRRMNIYTFDIFTNPCLVGNNWRTQQNNYLIIS